MWSLFSAVVYEGQKGPGQLVFFAAFSPCGMKFNYSLKISLPYAYNMWWHSVSMKSKSLLEIPMWNVTLKPSTIQTGRGQGHCIKTRLHSLIAVADPHFEIRQALAMSISLPFSFVSPNFLHNPLTWSCPCSAAGKTAIPFFVCLDLWVSY